MRLLFLSNTRGNNNEAVMSALRSWFTADTRIGYLPSSTDAERTYFREAESWLMMVRKDARVDYLEIHDGKKWIYESVEGYSCFFISGGNTYHLLDGLRRSGMGAILRRVVAETERGVIGVSAGGIVLTPDIRNARAQNDIGIRDHSGLSLVSFGFYPHFREDHAPTREEIRAFLDETTIRTVCFLPEYSGIMYDNGALIPLGEVFFAERMGRRLGCLLSMPTEWPISDPVRRADR